MELNINKLVIADVLDLVAAAKTRVEKVEILQKYNCLGLRDLLKGAFDDSIQWELPQGDPPYNEFDIQKKGWEYEIRYLNKTSKRLAYFVKGSPTLIQNTVKRERMFIDLLEMIHPRDAKLILLMKDKNMEGHCKGLTKKLVQTAFPRLIAK